LSRLLVTVEGPQKRVDIALAGDVPISDVIPTVLELCGPPPEEAAEPWGLGPPGAGLLPPSKSLRDCGIRDGAVLSLMPVSADTSTPEPPAQLPDSDGSAIEEAVSPVMAASAAPAQERTRWVLPQPVPVRNRLSSLGRALVTPVDVPEAAPHPSQSGPPSPGALTRPRSASVLQRARRAWWATDYRQRLDLAIAGPRLRKCPIIAVVSPKGGVGKTTVAALLGTLLAMIRSDRVVAVDTNPDYGTLGRSLAPEHTIYIDDFLDVLEHPALTVTLLDRSLGRAANGLMVLPAPRDFNRMSRLDADSYRRVIRKLQELVGVVVLDCGAGLHDPSARAAMAVADQLVLVSDAEPATASLVAEASRPLAEHGTPFLLVVNRMPAGGSRLDVEKLATHVPDARGFVVVPSQHEAAATLARGEFDWATAPAAWQVAIRELAAALVADWEPLGLTSEPVPEDREGEAPSEEAPRRE
jgi:MinD-like ATPase involved in chromosome partitioning or flagellar assembly